MTFLKTLPRFFLLLNAAFTVGFVIGLLTGDSYTYASYDGFVFQAIFAVLWGLSWIPASLWEAFFEILPYVLFWNAMSDL